MVVSSANERTFAFSACDISLIYIRNSRGPKMLPWGTPYDTGCDTDEVLPYVTYCRLSDKYIFIQLFGTP